MKYRAEIDYPGAPFWGTAIAVASVAVIWTTILGCQVIDIQLNKFSEARAFVEYTKDNYITVINNNNELAVKGLPNTPTWIPVDKMNQSTNTSDRIKEFLYKVSEYNRQIFQWQAFEKSYWWQPFFGELPEDFKPIKIEW
jgi:hypothetical protein